jgi:hypothetical protein
MPGEIPFFIEGRIVEILPNSEMALVKVLNGNIYHLFPYTPGIIFDSLRLEQTVRLEVTSALARVLSANILA